MQANSTRRTGRLFLALAGLSLLLAVALVGDLATDTLPARHPGTRAELGAAVQQGLDVPADVRRTAALALHP